MPSKPLSVIEICALQVLYQRNKNIVVVAKQPSRAEAVLSQIRELVLTVPERLRTKVTKDNKRQVDFDNGCSIQAHSIHGARGLGINVLVFAGPFTERERQLINLNYCSTVAVVLEVDE